MDTAQANESVIRIWRRLSFELNCWARNAAEESRAAAQTEVCSDTLNSFGCISSRRHDTDRRQSVDTKTQLNVPAVVGSRTSNHAHLRSRQMFYIWFEIHIFLVHSARCDSTLMRLLFVGNFRVDGIDEDDDNDKKKKHFASSLDYLSIDSLIEMKFYLWCFEPKLERIAVEVTEQERKSNARKIPTMKMRWHAIDPINIFEMHQIGKSSGMCSYTWNEIACRMTRPLSVPLPLELRLYGSVESKPSFEESATRQFAFQSQFEHSIRWFQFLTESPKTIGSSKSRKLDSFQPLMIRLLMIKL